MEGGLLDAIYSPFVVILLILYFVGWHTFVFARFKHSSIAMWFVFGCYNFVAIVFFLDGDSTIEGSSVKTWLSWYNVALIFVIVAVMRINHRAEALQRREFLTHYRNRRRSSKPLVSLAMIRDRQNRRRPTLEKKAMADRLSEYVASQVAKSIKWKDDVVVSLEESARNTFTERMLNFVRQTGAEDIPTFLKNTELDEAEAKTLKTEFELCDWKNLPPYQDPYSYVRTGYRANFTPWLCFKSIFKMHNETINIWTEFGPAVGFLVALISFMTEDLYLNAPWEDQVLVAFGLFGVWVIRPVCSGLAHTFHATTARGYILWWAVDYFSVRVLALFSFAACCCCCFACSPNKSSHNCSFSLFFLVVFVSLDYVCDIGCVARVGALYVLLQQ
jgi:hypothetical protein